MSTASVHPLAFARVLGTNYTPTDAERIVIQSLICRARANLLRHDINAPHFQTELTQLALERCDILNYIAAHQSLLSPIRRVPDELLAQIFTHCLPDETFVAPKVRYAPLLVSQICRRWRCVALSTPSLWSSIAIKGRDGTGSACGGPSALLRSWLSHSGILPLSISLSSLDRIEHADCLTAIIPHSHRWRRLALSLPTQSFNASLLSIPTTGFPTLEFFSIWSDFRAWDAVLWHFLTSLKDAPRLRDFACHLLNTHLRPGMPAILPIPWAQLTRLHLGEGLSPTSCLGVLSQCRQLVSCSISLAHASKSNPSQPVVVLNHLQTMSVASKFSPVDLLQHLVLPALRELEIGCPSIYPCPRVQPFGVSHLLSRSSCVLTELTLSKVHMPGEEFVDCLRLCPRLVKLAITEATPYRYLSNDMLEVMTYNPSSARTCLLPRLQVIEWAGPLQYSDAVFEAMISSRRPEGWRHWMQNGRGLGGDVAVMRYVVTDRTS